MVVNFEYAFIICFLRTHALGSVCSIYIIIIILLELK